MNYEEFHGINVDLKCKHIVTDIQVIANSSLGIDGWALYDVGSLEEIPLPSVPSRPSSWDQQAHGIFERRVEAGGCSRRVEAGARSVPLSTVLLQGSTLFSTAEDNCMTSIVGGLFRTHTWAFGR